MKIIDRLREMPEKRRAATEGPWFHTYNGLLCFGPANEPETVFDRQVPGTPENREYAIAASRFSSKDWDAIIGAMDKAKAVIEANKRGELRWHGLVDLGEALDKLGAFVPDQFPEVG